MESTAESSSELSGIVYTTDRDKHNGCTVDAIECTALDLCATQCGHWSRRNCVVNERGLRV